MKYLLAALLLLEPLVALADVAGRVLDAAGNPLANAEVFCWDYQEWKTVRSDARGRFAVPYQKAPGSARVCLFAVAPGLAVAAVMADPRRPAATLRLRPAREVVGKLLQPDATPAEGVAVRLMWVMTVEDSPAEAAQSAPTWADLPEALKARFSTRSDTAGTYRLAGLPPGDVQLEVRDPRYVTEHLRSSGNPPTLRLRHGCRIRGRLLNGEAGLGGRDVTAQSPALPGTRVSATTGADGSFVLEGIPSGEYRLTAPAMDDIKKTAAMVTATVSEERPMAEVTLRAVDGGVIIGRTVDTATGAAAPAVRMLVEGPHQALRDGWGVASGRDGTFRLRVPPGKTRLVAIPATGVPVDEQGVQVTVAEGQEAAVEVPARDWRAVSGQAVDAAGKPVPGLVITMQGKQHVSRIQTVTDAEGWFSIGGLPDGEVTLTARRGEEGFAVLLKPPFPADAHLVLDALPQVTLIGRVVDDRGRPAAAVPVALLRSLGPWSVGGVLEAQAKTDAQGRYRFLVRDLTADYSVGVGPGRLIGRGGGKSLGDGGAERRHSDLVVCSFGAAVDGKVLDPDGKPVAGATVFWVSGTRQHQTVSDAQGRFRVEALPDRPVTLAARDSQRRTAMARAAPGKEAVLRLHE